jgi:hypothetical protein
LQLVPVGDEAAKATAFHAVEPVLGKLGVVEQIILGGYFAALDGAGEKLVPLLGLAVAAAEPQRHEFGPLAGGQSLDLLHHFFAD